jgi:hypothetical protein
MVSFKKTIALKSRAKRSQNKEECELLVQEWWQNTNKSEAAAGIPEPERSTFETHNMTQPKPVK